jgi:hypothetical protein
MAPEAAIEVWAKDGWDADPEQAYELPNVEPSHPDESVLRRLRVYVDAGSGNFSCSLQNSVGESAATEVLSGLGKLSGNAGLRVYKVDAKFYSFTVYR